MSFEFTLEMSPTVTSLTVSLLAFHRQCPKIAKKEDNDFYRSKYADLPAILDTIKPVLESCELMIIQFPVGEFGLVTMLMHASGEFMRATSIMTPVKSVQDKANNIIGVGPQAHGSAITYHKRYGICAVLNLNVDEDDDGNAGSGKNGKKETTETAPPPKAGSQSKPPKAAANEPTGNLPPLSQEEYDSLAHQIQTGPMAGLEQLEKRANNLGIKGQITKDKWVNCTMTTLGRYIDGAGDVAKLKVLLGRVGSYVTKDILTTDQGAALTKRITDRITSFGQQ